MPLQNRSLATDFGKDLSQRNTKVFAGIDSLVEYYSKAGSNYQLLLFPEGTDKCPKATERSMKFAEKNNLIHYDYLLHPRTTGFAYILQKMKKVDYVEYVYDVTVAYNDAIVQSEVDLVTLGLCPKQVHFDIRKFSVKDLPETDSELDELDTLPNAQIFEMTPLARLLQIFIILVWVVLTICWMYFFFSYNYQGMVALVTIGFFVGAQYFYGGVEMIITEQAFKQWQVIEKEDKKNN
uniref:Phospholipid/glycerol acyltransferase domain-containing protein n=1 Tax=Ditylenchus dipsaci TaxID=166011 RepID=A0A915DPF6_9BILA